jgi:hypothetical protein
MPKKLALSLLLIACHWLFAQDLVITNVNVIPVNGKDTLLRGQTVYIKKGRIAQVVPFQPKHTANKLPNLVDGTGKYLMPGLADMHVHFPDTKEIPREEFFRLNLAAGVTSLRSMRGEPSHPGLRDSIRKGLLVAPDLYISTPLPSDSSVTAHDLKRFIVSAKKEKWDFVKYLSGLTPALFDSAARYCRENQIMLAGHVYNSDLQVAIKNGQASVEHYQSVLKAYRADSANFDKVLAQLKAKNMFVCPTLSFYYIWGLQIQSTELATRNGMENVRQELKNKWQEDFSAYLKGFEGKEKEFQAAVAKTKRNLAEFNRLLTKLNDAGVLLLLSPDESAFNVPGFAMAEEMKLYSKAGISNYDIVKIATRNAAAFFGAENQWGSIAKGRKANLVLLSKNPLENIENIKSVSGTVLNGKFYPPASLLKK